MFIKVMKFFLKHEKLGKQFKLILTVNLKSSLDFFHGKPWNQKMDFTLILKYKQDFCFVNNDIAQINNFFRKVT